MSESATNRRLSKNFLCKIWKARLLEVSSIQTLTPLIVLALFAQEGNLPSGSSVPSSGVVEYSLKWSSFVYSMDKNEVARLWEIAKSLQIKNLFGYKVPDPLPAALNSLPLELKQECLGGFSVTCVTFSCALGRCLLLLD